MASILERLGFLKTLGVGEVQSDEEMTVVPLLGHTLGEIAPPEALKFTRTTDYGSMEYVNEDENLPAIVPTHIMVRGKGAQDHAMAGSGILLKASGKLFENACCIESSQGGYLSGEQFDMDILPFGLRLQLLDPRMREKEAYDKLWGSISKWLSGLKHVDSYEGRSHLRDFFDQPLYKEALETFSAAFEPVEGQIGAVILFSGVPVGLEVMPSVEHWLAYWKLLIRGCYGAQLIKLKEQGEIKPSTMTLPDIPANADGDIVKAIMTEFISNIKKSMGPLLQSINVSKQLRIDSSENMTIELIRTETGGGGDIITQSSKPVYLSLVL